MMEAVAVKRVAVLGAGTIGGSWVSWFLARGMQVTVWDPRSGAADFVLRYVADAWLFGCPNCPASHAPSYHRRRGLSLPIGLIRRRWLGELHGSH